MPLLRIAAAALGAAAALAVAAPPAAALAPLPATRPATQPLADEEPTDAPTTTTTTTTTATTTPSATPPPYEVDDDGGGEFSLGGRVRKMIVDFFRSIVTEGIEPTLDTISDRALKTPEVTRTREVHGLWQVSWAITNSVYVLAVLAAGVLLLTHETVHTSYTVKEFAPRLVLGWIAANASLGLAQLGIGLANDLSGALLGGPMASATRPLSEMAAAPLDHGGIFIILLALVVLVLALILLCTCVLRIFTVTTLIVAAPLMLAAHALPGTQGMARFWWRAFTGCLGVQVGQALAMSAAVRVFFAGDGGTATGLGRGSAMDMVLIICVLWSMVRIPAYAGRMVFGTQPTRLLQAVQHIVVYRAVSRVMPSLSAGRGRGERHARRGGRGWATAARARG